jgi:NAD(P)H-hydrate epimerase
VLSLDVPSGVDSATGAVFEPAVRASATMTLALPKTGLVASQAKQDVPVLFADSEVVSLR